MEIAEHPTETLLTITPAAAAKVKELMSEEPDAEQLVLRVAIEGGGCSGFQYGLGFDRGSQEGDLELSLHGVPVVVDDAKCIADKGCTVCVDVCPLDVLAISTYTWRRSTQTSIAAISGAAGPVLTTPPGGPSWPSGTWNHPLVFVNGHGAQLDPTWYGEQSQMRMRHRDAFGGPRGA